MCDGHTCIIPMSINVSAIKCTLIPVKVTFSLSVNVLCNKYRLAFIHCIRLYVLHHLAWKLLWVLKSDIQWMVHLYQGFCILISVDITDDIKLAMHKSPLKSHLLLLSRINRTCTLRCHMFSNIVICHFVPTQRQSWPMNFTQLLSTANIFRLFQLFCNILIVNGTWEHVLR